MSAVDGIESRLLGFVRCFEGRLPEGDLRNAAELISKREWGVGLEVLCAQLAEYEVTLDAVCAKELKSLAEELQIDISGFGLV